MAFKKGKEKTGGRKKGVKNRLTIDVQQEAFKIFKALGGTEKATEYFDSSKQAKAQFYNLFFRMLPSDVKMGAGDDDGLIMRIEFVPAGQKKEERKEEG